jgi:hypothetical protein
MAGGGIRGAAGEALAITVGGIVIMAEAGGGIVAGMAGGIMAGIAGKSRSRHLGAGQTTTRRVAPAA